MEDLAQLFLPNQCVVKFLGAMHHGIEIEATENELTIKGKRSLEAPEGYRALRRERGELAFEESFSFETALDLDKVEAKLDNGMLRIELTKQAKARPRSIEIKAA